MNKTKSATIQENLIIPPEYIEAEVLAEKVNLKHPFEDDFQIQSLPIGFKEFKRLNEVLIELSSTGGYTSTRPISASGNIAGNTAASGQLVTPGTNSGTNANASASSINITKSGTVSNSNILPTTSSPFNLELDILKRVCDAFMIMKEAGEVLDIVYPKKDSPNPSGKYIVKLFFMGLWRKVIVDDRIPIGAEGKLLCVGGNGPQEWEKFVICKAILKLYAISPDIDIIQTLRGYVPELLPLKPLSHSTKLLEKLLINTKIYPKKDPPAQTSAPEVQKPTGRVLTATFNNSKTAKTTPKERYTAAASSSLITAGAFRILEAGEYIHPRVFLIKDKEEKWIPMNELIALGPIKTYHMPGKYAKQIANGMVLTIQEGFEGILIDLCQSKVVVEEFGWKEGPGHVVIKTSVNAFMNLKAGSYRVCVEGSGSVIFHSGQEYAIEEEFKFLERQGLKVKEWEEVSALQQPHNYMVLFKYVVNVVDEAVLLMSLTDLPGVLLRIINNDDGADMGMVTYPHCLPSAKSGYTIMAESRTGVNARQPTKWKFRVASDQPLSDTLITKLNIQDITEPYIPNKHKILFRNVIKVKDSVNLTLLLTFSEPISLTCFDNDIEIWSISGMGTISIPSFTFYADKHRYIIQAKTTSNSPRKIITPPTPTSRKGKPEDLYNLRIITSDQNYTITKDTHQQDFYKQIKMSWETAQPGRLVKSREAREAYKPMPLSVEGLKVWTVVRESCPVVEIVGRRESIIGSVPAPSKARARRPSILQGDETVTFSTKLVNAAENTRVLTPLDIENMAKSRLALIKATSDAHIEIAKTRVVEKEKRNESKRRVMDIVQAKISEVEEIHGIDFARKEAVRAAVLAKLEEENAKLRMLQEEKAAMAQEEENAAKSAKKRK